MTTKKTTTKNARAPKGKIVTREVSIELDEKTYAKFGKEEGELMRNVGKLREEFSDVKRKWDDRIEPLTDRLEFVRESLKNGKETKTIECRQVKNFDEGRMEWWYDGKVVDHRPLTTTDHQEEIPLKTKRGRTKENSVVVPPKAVDDEIGNVRKLETSRRTKHTSTDGPVGKGHEHSTTDQPAL